MICVKNILILIVFEENFIGILFVKGYIFYVISMFYIFIFVWIFAKKLNYEKILIFFRFYSNIFQFFHFFNIFYHNIYKKIYYIF